MKAYLRIFLKVAMSFWFHENDAVKQLFSNDVLVLAVGVRDLLQFDVCLPVNRGLSIRCCPDTLMIEQC